MNRDEILKYLYSFEVRVKSYIKIRRASVEFNQEFAAQMSNFVKDGRFSLHQKRKKPNKLREILSACKLINSLHRVKLNNAFLNQL